MEVDPFRAPFQIQPLVCPAMLMYWPILSFLIGRLTKEQEQAFRALMNTGDDTQQSLGLPGHQAGSVDRAAPTPGNPGQGNATGPVPTPGILDRGMPQVQLLHRGNLERGRAAPRTRGPVPPPGNLGRESQRSESVASGATDNRPGGLGKIPSSGRGLPPGTEAADGGKPCPWPWTPGL